MSEWSKIALGSLLLCCCLVLLTMDFDGPARQVRHVAVDDVDKAAQLILAQGLEQKISRCAEYSATNRSHQFAQAVVLVENMLTNPLERHVENLLGNLIPAFVAWLDLSVGPAQIKASSFQSYGVSSNENIRSVLKPCFAFVEIVRRVNAVTKGNMSIEERWRFLETHTGVHDFKMMNVIYNRLVDSVYLQVRWQEQKNRTLSHPVFNPDTAIPRLLTQ